MPAMAGIDHYSESMEEGEVSGSDMSISLPASSFVAQRKGTPTDIYRQSLLRSIKQLHDLGIGYDALSKEGLDLQILRNLFEAERIPLESRISPITSPPVQKPQVNKPSRSEYLEALKKTKTQTVPVPAEPAKNTLLISVSDLRQRALNSRKPKIATVIHDTEESAQQNTAKPATATAAAAPESQSIDPVSSIESDTNPESTESDDDLVPQAPALPIIVEQDHSNTAFDFLPGLGTTNPPVLTQPNQLLSEPASTSSKLPNGSDPRVNSASGATTATAPADRPFGEGKYVNQPNTLVIEASDGEDGAIELVEQIVKDTVDSEDQKKRSRQEQLEMMKRRLIEMRDKAKTGDDRLKQVGETVKQVLSGQETSPVIQTQTAVSQALVESTTNTDPHDASANDQDIPINEEVKTAPTVNDHDSDSDMSISSESQSGVQSVGSTDLAVLTQAPSSNAASSDPKGLPGLDATAMHQVKDEIQDVPMAEPTSALDMTLPPRPSRSASLCSEPMDLDESSEEGETESSSNSDLSDADDDDDYEPPEIPNPSLLNTAQGGGDPVVSNQASNSVTAPTSEADNSLQAKIEDDHDSSMDDDEDYEPPEPSTNLPSVTDTSENPTPQRQKSPVTIASVTEKPLHEAYSEYQSPLTMFKNYRNHPQYTKDVSGGYRSLTYSNNIDPNQPLCPYECNRGVCNDSSCQFQHFRSMSISDDELLAQMVGANSSLRTALNEMRGHDADTKAAHIAVGRQQLLGDAFSIFDFPASPASSPSRPSSPVP